MRVLAFGAALLLILAVRCLAEADGPPTPSTRQVQEAHGFSREVGGLRTRLHQLERLANGCYEARYTLYAGKGFRGSRDNNPLTLRYFDALGFPVPLQSVNALGQVQHRDEDGTWLCGEEHFSDWKSDGTRPVLEFEPPARATYVSATTRFLNPKDLTTVIELRTEKVRLPGR